MRFVAILLLLLLSINSCCQTARITQVLDNVGSYARCGNALNDWFLFDCTGATSVNAFGLFSWKMMITPGKGDDLPPLVVRLIPVNGNAVSNPPADATVGYRIEIPIEREDSYFVFYNNTQHSLLNLTAHIQWNPAIHSGIQAEICLGGNTVHSVPTYLIMEGVMELHSCNNNASSCTFCPCGRYNETSDMMVEVGGVCEDGIFGDGKCSCDLGYGHKNSSPDCKPCPKGYISDGDTCNACPSSMNETDPFSAICLCNPGYEYDHDYQNCSICEIGMYKPASENSECLVCPSPLIITKPGAIDLSDCSCGQDSVNIMNKYCMTILYIGILSVLAIVFFSFVILVGMKVCCVSNTTRKNNRAEGDIELTSYPTYESNTLGQYIANENTYSDAPPPYQP